MREPVAEPVRVQAAREPDGPERVRPGRAGPVQPGPGAAGASRTRNYRGGVAGTGHLALTLPCGTGHCRQPVLLALPVQGIHALRFQGNRGVPEVRELVHQDGPLCAGLGHGLALGVVGPFGVELAGLRGPRGFVGCPVGVCGRSRQRLGGGGRGLRRFEGPGAAGCHGLKRGGLLQGVAGPGDKGAQGRVQPAAAVEIAGELADLLARLRPAPRRLPRPCGGNRGGVAPELQLHERFAVGVVGLQGGCEAGILRARRRPPRSRSIVATWPPSRFRWPWPRQSHPAMESPAQPGLNSRNLTRRDRCGCAAVRRAREAAGIPGVRRRRTARPSFGRKPGPKSCGRTSLQCLGLERSEVAGFRREIRPADRPARSEATCQWPLWQHWSHQ